MLSQSHNTQQHQVDTFAKLKIANCEPKCSTCADKKGCFIR